MSTKEQYKQLCKTEKTIPLFSQDWWLDAVCGADNWDVVLYQKGDDILGSLPYYKTTKFGFTFIKQPPLTQFNGPWIKSTDAKYQKELEHQKDIIQYLYNQLPSFSSLSQNWAHHLTNWLPLHWKGFKQTNRYTYVLHHFVSTDDMWDEMSGSIRREIKKAKDRYSLRILEEPSIDDFLALMHMTYERQNMDTPYSDEHIKSLYNACLENGCGKLFIAQDNEGKNHAAAFIVWDRFSAYYLAGGADPELRNSGAMSFCLWEAIQFSATTSKHFDFEGSMIEPIERFFRRFGAKQTPYHNVNKTPSRIIRIVKAIRAIF